MIKFSKLFSRKKWVVYYDMTNKKYHVDIYGTNKKPACKSTDMHFLLIFLQLFDSRRAAEAFAERRREDDRQLDFD